MAFDWKKLARPTVVGGIVAIGLPTANGLVAKLTFIPSIAIGSISVPHTLIAAGILAFIGTLVSDAAFK